MHSFAIVVLIVLVAVPLVMIRLGLRTDALGSVHRHARAHVRPESMAAAVVGSFLRSEPCDIDPIGFHECRHTYRSWLNAAGVDPTRADWYLGHANHTVSGRYQHALPGQLAKDAETLDSYLTGAAEGKVVTLRTGAHPGAQLARTAQQSGV